MADDLVLTAVLKADASGMQSGFSQASSAMGQFKQAADSTGSSAGGFGAMLSNLGIKLPTFGSVMGGVASIAGGVFSGALGLASQGVGMLKDQFSDTIQVAEQHQTIMSQTTQAIKSTGDACGLSAQAVEGLAESLSKTTTFSEDTIQSGENLMLTFTGIGKDVFPQTTQTMLDMAQAMHMGPTQAAMQLGKALNDPAKGLSALTREGVTFSDSEKTMIKQMVAAGDTAGAQKIMLKELQTEFGGSAQAAGKTFAGALQILKNNLEDVKIKVGTAVLPIMSQFTGWISSAALPLLSRFGDWFGSVATPAIQSFSNSVGKAFTYVNNMLRTVDLSDFKDAWTDVKQAVNELGQTFQFLASKLHPVAVDFDPLANTIQRLAQGALNALTGMLWKAYEAISAVSGIFHGGKGPLEDFGNALKQIGADLQPTAAILGGQFKADLAWLGNTFNQIGGWIKSSLMPALATLVPPFMSIADTVAKNILPAWATMYATGHQLVISVLTPLIGVLEKIIPPVITVAGWLLGGLAEGFKFVAPLVKGLADAISNVVNFFTKTEVGTALVKAALITLSIPVGILALAFLSLAIDSIAAFLASIPAMVGGFLAGAGAAWSMAVAVIAATWPILAIIAVIALIILAIQHWGDIVNWLKGAWSAVTGFFSGLWNDIKNIFGGVGKWFQDRFSEASKGVQDAWNGLQNHAKDAGKKIQDAWSDASKKTSDTWNDASKKTSDAFMYMYKHSYVFQAIVDNLIGSTKAGIAMFQSAWNAVTSWFVGVWTATSNWFIGVWTTTSNWLVGAWKTIVKFASDLWTQVSNAVKDGWNAAVKWVQDTWTSISNTFAAAWNTYIVKPLTALWTSISTFFSNVWTNYVANPLADLWKNVSKAFSDAWTDHVSKPVSDLGTNISNAVANWATSAWQWGVNLITSLANGIVSAAKGALTSAITSVANIVKALIGWHSPTKEGPGSDSDKWAPALVKMMSEGLEAGIPQIQSAVNKLAMPIALSLNPAASNYKSTSNFKYPAAGTGSGGAAPIVVNVHPVVQPNDIYLNDKKLTDAVATRLVDKIRMKGGVRSH